VAPVDGFKGSLDSVGVKLFTLIDPVETSSRPILWFDRHHPSAPTCTRLVPARAVAVKDGPSSGHRVSGAQRP